MVGNAVDAIRRFAGHDVCVRLTDGSTFSGRLRTELVSDRALSVYITSHGGDGEGVTLYIDQIAEIVPIDPPAAP
jgi:hypothetical protein